MPSKRYCSVPGCSKIDDCSSLTFHKFPNDEARRQEWIRSLNITKNVTGNMVVCGKHFKPDHYFKKRNAEGKETQP